MSTYSIYPGQPTEAFKLPDISSVLNELPDNTTKLINPHNLRDAVYTAWENIAFKPTTNSSDIEYVGFDQSTFREKIFLGKKQLGNTDVLNSLLLNSDVDIFLYNTKSDSNLSEQNTKIGFLAGPSQSIFYGSTLSIPWLEAKYITSTYGNVIDLDIINNSYAQSGASFSGGNINIYSRRGTVLINGLSFPTLAQNTSVTNGYVLSYQSGFLQWTPNTVVVSSISQSGTFSITANPLIINGYNAMFSSSVPVPATLGAITAGSTFSNIAVTEMIRLMLYPYIAPTLSLSTNSTLIEYRTSATIGITFSYTITKYIVSSTVSVFTSPNFISDTLAQTYLNGAPTINRVYTGTSSYTTPTSFTAPLAFTLSVSDQVGTYSAGVTVNPAYPIFYGTSNIATSSQAGINSILGSLNKIITTNPNQTVTLNGNGVCLYYLVPTTYNLSASMSSLYSGTSSSFDLKSVFRGDGTPFVVSISSPIGYWVGVSYNCYVYSPFGSPITTSIGSTPLYTANYQFNF